MLQTYPNIKRAIINDSNLDLMRTYNTVRDRAKELVVELKKIQKEFIPLYEEERHEYFNDIREEFNTRRSGGIRHAAIFIFLNKTSNANYRTNGNGAFNGAYNHLQNPIICDERTIYADSKLLQRVTICCGDYEKTYNEASGNTFFFLDPPYRPTGKRHGSNEFNDKEQIRLKKFCDLLSFRHFQWMLTNSDGKSQNPDDTFMEQLYSNYNIERIWSKNAIIAKPEKRDKLSELLVRNFQREILSLRDVHYRQLSFAF
jgi:DNA adenine methylase